MRQNEAFVLRRCALYMYWMQYMCIYVFLFICLVKIYMCSSFVSGRCKETWIDYESTWTYFPNYTVHLCPSLSTFHWESFKGKKRVRKLQTMWSSHSFWLIPSLTSKNNLVDLVVSMICLVFTPEDWGNVEMIQFDDPIECVFCWKTDGLNHQLVLRVPNFVAVLGLAFERVDYFEIQLVLTRNKACNLRITNICFTKRRGWFFDRNNHFNWGNVYCR